MSRLEGFHSQSKLISYHLILCIHPQNRDRVKFVLGDACDLQPLGEFGCVFCSNVLCTLKQPQIFLRDTHKYLVPGGTLVMAENYMRHGEGHEVSILYNNVPIII